MDPKVAIVVLTWNQRDLTLDCLASLAELEYPAEKLGIIVVDNGSQDGTAQAVQERYPQVVVLQNSQNLGFAGGNDVGIRWALEKGAEFIAILNNDVTVEPWVFGQLVAALQQHPEAGIATPLIVESVNDEVIWALGLAIDWHTATVSRRHAGEPVEAWRQRPAFDVEIAAGAAMLVRREVLERVGLLDESFFLYYEEVDWCLRARQAGYRILAVPSSVVWHKVSATLGKTSPVIDYYMLRNHLRLIVRHWSGVRRPYLLAKTVARNLATVAAYTVESQQGNRIPNRNARLLALRDALLARWGKMGPDVAAACSPRHHR